MTSTDSPLYLRIAAQVRERILTGRYHRYAPSQSSPTGLRVEAEDAGGRWNRTPPGDGRPHGFDLIEALTGHENWGINGDATGRVAWARIEMP